MHRRHVLSRAVLGLGLVLLPTLAFAGARALPGKDPGREGRSGPPYLPVAVPCGEAVLELTLTIAMVETFSDSTFGDGVVDAYSCQPGWAETGPEHIYVLTASEELIADIWLATNVPNDHDLILLTDCDSDSCLVQANSEMSVHLTAGTTVYLVVDGFLGAAGSYELTLETRPVGIPDGICNGDATPLDFDQTGSIGESGTLFDRPNLVSLYDCAPYSVRGGEQWYALSFAPADTDTVGFGYGEMIQVNIAAVPLLPYVDLALWVFAGCGPDAECLAFVDDTNAGFEEVLLWNNPGAEDLTVYLAVDCFAPPDSAAAGAYDLIFESAVPVEESNLSGMRNLFR